ncbi:MAG TPA: tRNA (adenosine(37)-N6)-threonylcarbamoyltransferase complex dimerization subunit type 1 TsaB [Chloroflexi bacterium]|jgi:tRNA threonylcarbamoyladenosine biosynthesis protein TsaB|nr:tRNA (adenosine(37)-N6)-threonylcarbamoyltransferase complex dimerization subunit type 1 TsaB [Anaerolineaceae bacterium]HHX09227.1 tRNA (adenosine(37)-N6)-threonylcarbamoyltransferase complex dimerization subunit type 1 TsaB [Chloroflexota bacterium]
MLVAIDTSTQWIGIALYDGTRVLAEHSWRSKNYHTIELIPAIADMLAKCQVRPNQLTGIGVALGPGSFTGLRIGLSAAKGLALGQNLPTAGVPSLDVLAASQPGLRRPMIALLEVGRGRYAWARYRYKNPNWGQISEIRVDDIKDIAATITSPVYVVGDMGAEERQIMGRKWKTSQLAPASQCVRRPSVLAELAWNKLQVGHADDVVSLSPIYVHTLSNLPED